MHRPHSFARSVDRAFPAWLKVLVARRFGARLADRRFPADGPVGRLAPDGSDAFL